MKAEIGELQRSFGEIRLLPENTDDFGIFLILSPLAVSCMQQPYAALKDPRIRSALKN
jgi:hypothetical protein